MDWRKEYAEKIVSVEEAVSHVQSGNRIVFTHACGEAQALTDELVRQADRLENVEIVHMVAMGKAPYCQPGMEKHFRHNALFVGGSTRKAVEEGRGDYTPCFFHEIPIGIGHIFVNLCNNQLGSFCSRLCIVNRNPIRANAIFIGFTEL